MNRKNDFDQPTKDKLAKRAGFKCSICKATTIGGAIKDTTLSASIGVAAHIYAAVSGGPRGNSNLSTEEIKHIDNGIHLCENHAKLIDTNGGLDYTAEELIRIKLEHESEVRESIGKIPIEKNISEVSGHIKAHTNKGNVVGLDIQKATRLMPGTIIDASSNDGDVTGVKIS